LIDIVLSEIFLNFIRQYAVLRKNKTPAAVFPRKANIINWKSCVIRANKRNIYAYVYYYVRCRVFSAAFDVLKGLSVDFTACRVWFPTRLICVLSRFASRLQNGENFDRVLYHRVVCVCVCVIRKIRSSEYA